METVGENAHSPADMIGNSTVSLTVSTASRMVILHVPEAWHRVMAASRGR